MNAAQSHLQTLADTNLDAVAAKDADAVVAGFSDDGVLIDPHYPDREMRGKSSIREGLQFGFDSMKTFSVEDRRYFYSPDDIHCTCHHVLSTGRPLNFPQIFVMSTHEGRITRWQAFEPYGPNGLGGLFLGIGKTVYRARRALQQRSVVPGQK